MAPVFLVLRVGLRLGPGLVLGVVPGVGLASVLAGQSPAGVSIASPGASGARRFELGVAAGSLIDPPTQFAPGCEQQTVSVSGHGSWWPSRVVGIEGGAMVTGEVGAISCILALRPAPPRGVPFDRIVYDERLEGARFFATQLGASVAPFPEAPVSPRARAGLGRIWAKALDYRYVGAGVRYRFGRHALVMDVERWRYTIDGRSERVVLTQAGDLQLLYAEDFEQAERSYHFRVGWEVEVR